MIKEKDNKELGSVQKSSLIKVIFISVCYQENEVFHKSWWGLR